MTRTEAILWLVVVFTAINVMLAVKCVDACRTSIERSERWQYERTHVALGYLPPHARKP